MTLLGALTTASKCLKEKEFVQPLPTLMRSETGFSRYTHKATAPAGTRASHPLAPIFQNAKQTYKVTAAEIKNY